MENFSLCKTRPESSQERILCNHLRRDTPQDLGWNDSGGYFKPMGVANIKGAPGILHLSINLTTTFQGKGNYFHFTVGNMTIKEAQGQTDKGCGWDHMPFKENKPILPQCSRLSFRIQSIQGINYCPLSDVPKKPKAKSNHFVSLVLTEKELMMPKCSFSGTQGTYLQCLLNQQDGR